MTKTIELIRVSTDGQAGDDRASIPAQRAVNRSTIQRFGLEVVHTIELTDVSGASVLLAPEIQRLIELIQSPDIGAVVTREFSRLMRPEKFSDYALLQAFADSKTKLYLPEGPIDFAEKSGRLMGTIRAAIAGLERSEIQERCWRGKEEKRKAGKSASGSKTLPIGVGYERQRGFYYTAASQSVLRAYDMVLSGETRYSVISQSTGLSEGQICNILRNPIWRGWRVYDQKADSAKYHSRPGGRQGWCDMVPRPMEEIIRVKVIDEPLVTDEVWEKVCRVLDQKRDAHRRERSHTTATYNGFLFCERCGAALNLSYGHGHSGTYYVCRNQKKPGKGTARCDLGYIRVSELDKVIDRILMHEVNSLDFAHQVADQLTKRHKDGKRDGRIDGLHRELQGLLSKKDRIAESYIDGAIGKEDRDHRLKSINAHISTVTDNLAREQQVFSPVLSVDQIAMAFRPFAEWQTLGREDKRRILAVTIPRIRVDGESVTGFYRLLDDCEVSIPSPENRSTKIYRSWLKNPNVTDGDGSVPAHPTCVQSEQFTDMEQQCI